MTTPEERAAQWGWHGGAYKKPGSLGWLIAGLVLFGSCALCSVLTSQRKYIWPTRVVVNIPQLAGKSAKEVDTFLGKPTEITPTDDAGTTPGEFRDYKIPGVSPKTTSDGLMVRFYRGNAVHFTLELPEGMASPEDALAMAGIDVQNASHDTLSPLAITWAGTFNGVWFKRVTALRLEADSLKYTVIQAEVVQ